MSLMSDRTKFLSGEKHIRLSSGTCKATRRRWKSLNCLPSIADSALFKTDRSDDQIVVWLCISAQAWLRNKLERRKISVSDFFWKLEPTQIIYFQTRGKKLGRPSDSHAKLSLVGRFFKWFCSAFIAPNDNDGPSEKCLYDTYCPFFVS